MEISSSDYSFVPPADKTERPCTSNLSKHENQMRPATGASQQNRRRDKESERRGRKKHRNQKDSVQEPEAQLTESQRYQTLLQQQKSIMRQESCTPSEFSEECQNVRCKDPQYHQQQRGGQQEYKGQRVEGKSKQQRYDFEFQPRCANQKAVRDLYHYQNNTNQIIPTTNSSAMSKAQEKPHKSNNTGTQTVCVQSSSTQPSQSIHESQLDREQPQNPEQQNMRANPNQQVVYDQNYSSDEYLDQSNNMKNLRKNIPSIEMVDTRYHEQYIGQQLQQPLKHQTQKRSNQEYQLREEDQLVDVEYIDPQHSHQQYSLLPNQVLDYEQYDHVESLTPMPISYQIHQQQQQQLQINQALNEIFSHITNCLFNKGTIEKYFKQMVQLGRLLAELNVPLQDFYDMMVVHVQGYLAFSKEQIMAQLKLLVRRPTRSLSAGAIKEQQRRELRDFKTNQSQYIATFNAILDNYLNIAHAVQALDEIWLYCIQYAYPNLENIEVSNHQESRFEQLSKREFVKILSEDYVAAFQQFCCIQHTEMRIQFGNLDRELSVCSTYADVRRRVTERYGGFTLAFLVIKFSQHSLNESVLFSQVQRTQRLAQSFKCLNNKDLVIDTAKMLNTIISSFPYETYQQSSNKQTMPKRQKFIGNGDQNQYLSTNMGQPDILQTTKTLKNRKKKQKRIEKKLVRQILETRVIQQRFQDVVMHEQHLSQRQHYQCSESYQSGGSAGEDSCEQDAESQQIYDPLLEEELLKFQANLSKQAQRRQSSGRNDSKRRHRKPKPNVSSTWLNNVRHKLQDEQYWTILPQSQHQIDPSSNHTAASFASPSWYGGGEGDHNGPGSGRAESESTFHNSPRQGNILDMAALAMKMLNAAGENQVSGSDETMQLDERERLTLNNLMKSA